MSEFQAVRPNLEVAELGPAVAHLVDVFAFELEVHEEEMGLALLRRDAVALAVVRTSHPHVNETTAAYVTVTDVDALYASTLDRGGQVIIPLTDHPWGLRDFVAEIPGGHRLAFGARLA